MFEPFSKGTGEDARPTWKDDVVTAGRYKAHIAPSPSSSRPPRPPRTSLQSARIPASALPPPTSPSQIGRAVPRPRRVSLVLPQDSESGGWWLVVMRPSRERVEGWLESWWKRWSVLVVLPCLVVWLWVAVPFPVADPYQPGDSWHWPTPWSRHWPIPWTPSPSILAPEKLASLVLRFTSSSQNETTPDAPDGDDDDTLLPLDLNFFFFLLFYYGVYLHVALLFTTKIFDLYRLNWWPKRIGGAISYFFFWAAALTLGWLVHDLDLIGAGGRKEGGDRGTDWERKTFWIGLTFGTMAMPALVCFSVLKRDKRHLYRHSLTNLQKAFLSRQLARRIPASYLRFLWFMAALGTALFALIAGQAYTSIYLSTLPHTSVDAAIWVWSWVGTTTCLSIVSSQILENKVRSKGLLFLFKYFSHLVYFVFYRNLFARLRSPADFIVVQSLSTVGMIIIFPLQMTSFFHRALVLLVGYPKTLEEHREGIAINVHTRSIAQNVSMVGFLGWLAILHFGPNSAVYPFFRFEDNPEDPYNFQFTFWASSVIWASELSSSLVMRLICKFAFKVDINGVGFGVMKEYPELVSACGWTSVHVLMNILMFLLKLNFR